MFKKGLPLVVALLLTVLVCSTALAAEQPAIADQEQALAAAKKLLPEVVVDKQFEIEYREDDYQGKRVWTFTREQSSQPGFHTWLHITIDADTGELLNYHNSTRPAVQGETGKIITRDAARETAIRFIARMQPELINQMRIEDNNSLPNYYGQRNLDLGYSFQWFRVINGIPVQRDGINVQVDAVTGNVIGYNFTWNRDIKAPTTGEKMLDKQQIADVVVANQGFYPSYIAGTDNTAQLVYRLNSSSINFDATTGNPVVYDGSVLNGEEGKTFTTQLAPEIGSKEIKVVQPTEKIDPMEAQKIAEKFFEQRGLKGTVRRSGGGTSVGPGYRSEHWSYSIEKSGAQSGGNYDINVGIDVFTGKVIDYWNDEKTNRSGKTISQQQAVTKAERFLKDALGDSVKYVAQNVPQYYAKADEGNYYFQYNVLVNGVPVDTNNITIEVNRYSGEVVRFDYPGNYLNVPEVDKVISDVEAALAFKKATPLKLSYANVTDDQYRPTDKLMLVYQLDGMRGIDARTGQVLDGADTSHSLAAILANHWARAPLELLADSGLLPEEGFNPDGNVTRREAIRVLMAASQYGYGGDGAPLQLTDIEPSDKDIEQIRMAVQLGMITNQGQLSPEAPLTREQLAVWLVNGIGHREVAELPVKIEVQFKDQASITAKYRNHVAIAAGLGIFSGDKNGNFNPQQSVTWAELATIVTRVAPKLGNRYY